MVLPWYLPWKYAYCLGTGLENIFLNAYCLDIGLENIEKNACCLDIIADSVVLCINIVFFNKNNSIILCEHYMWVENYVQCVT